MNPSINSSMPSSSTDSTESKPSIEEVSSDDTSPESAETSPLLVSPSPSPSHLEEVQAVQQDIDQEALMAFIKDMEATHQPIANKFKQIAFSSLSNLGNLLSLKAILAIHTEVEDKNAYYEFLSITFIVAKHAFSLASDAILFVLKGVLGGLVALCSQLINKVIDESPDKKIRQDINAEHIIKSTQLLDHLEGNDNHEIAQTITTIIGRSLKTQYDSNQKKAVVTIDRDSLKENLKEALTQHYQKLNIVCQLPDDKLAQKVEDKYQETIDALQNYFSAKGYTATQGHTKNNNGSNNPGSRLSSTVPATAPTAVENAEDTALSTPRI